MSITMSHPMAAKMVQVRKNPKPHEACPFHCGQDRYPPLDDRGYCKHIVGWTIDGEIMEVREKFGPSGSDRERVGVIKAPVEETDIVVEMATDSFRVYRAGANAPFEEDNYIGGNGKPRKAYRTEKELIADEKKRLEAENKRLMEELALANEIIAEKKANAK